MSEIVIHLQLEPYLAQWLINAHDSLPVEFPRNSAENDILEIYLIRTPPFPAPNEPGENTVPIAVPFFKSKDVRGKKYLPLAARNTLKRCIRNRFVIQLWSDLFRMDAHGIEATETNWNTIAKIYDRKRRAYNMRIYRAKIKKS